jgi:hypothetical protein
MKNWNTTTRDDIPFPESRQWKCLGQHVRQTVRARRRRRTGIVAVACLACVGGALMFRLAVGGGDVPAVADSGGAVLPSNSEVRSPSPADARAEEAADPVLAELDVLMLQVEIDSLGVAVQRSGLNELGVTDRDVWEGCGIDTAQVFEHYMGLL